jgi:magnesium transporter
MNFHDMPELQLQHGYWLALAITAVSTAVTYFFFKKRKWF